MLNLAPEPKKLRWTVIMEPTNSQGHVNFRLGEMPLGRQCIPMTSYAGMKKKKMFQKE